MWTPEEDVGSLEIGIKDGCELPYGCWGSNPGPLQEYQVLLTTEPSWQPFKKIVFICRISSLPLHMVSFLSLKSPHFFSNTDSIGETSKFKCSEFILYQSVLNKVIIINVSAFGVIPTVTPILQITTHNFNARIHMKFNCSKVIKCDQITTLQYVYIYLHIDIT